MYTSNIYRPQAKQTSLTNEQKQAVSLLSVGTLLEYFDLMLYVHMAVLLNDLFFPKADQHAASLLASLTYCSTFAFRPIGAFILGRLGDKYGRKITIIITTGMMAACCIVMANLPTCEQIGITAAWLITICRIAQGISSMGEVVGAELYLTEATKPPVQYPAVTSVIIFGDIGSILALGVAVLVTSFGFNWRIAFWIGAVIALIGVVARTALRETADFADAKRQLEKTFKDINLDKKKLEDNPIYNEKINPKSIVALFLMNCTLPLFSYFTFFYCAGILKNSFSYSAEQIIYHNFLLTIVRFFASCSLAYLSYKIYPLRILRWLSCIFIPFILICPYLLDNLKTSQELFLIQAFIMLFFVSPVPATPILFKHFPVFKRFTSISLLWAISRAMISIISSFGLVYLTKYFGNNGLLVVIVPIILGYVFGLFHFEKLEKDAGNYF